MHTLITARQCYPWKQRPQSNVRSAKRIFILSNRQQRSAVNTGFAMKKRGTAVVVRRLCNFINVILATQHFREQENEVNIEDRANVHMFPADLKEMGETEISHYAHSVPCAGP